MNKSDCFEWGRVVRPQGLKGAVVVHVDADDPEKYRGLDAVLVELNGQLVPYLVENIQFSAKAKALLKLEDVNTAEQAAQLVKSFLYLPLQALPLLEKGGFYYHDVVGFDVEDQQEGMLGKVTAFYSKPGQDLLAMEYKGAEVLIPVIDDVVTGADFDRKVVLVRLPEGLLDIYGA